VNVTASALGIASSSLTSTQAAAQALDAVTTAITRKDSARASFGYMMNRLESTNAVLNIQAENLMASESRISDVDVATEMASLTRNQVLSQAGISMLAQANTMPQMALSLLR
jgi:flagellin